MGAVDSVARGAENNAKEIMIPFSKSCLIILCELL